jgi:hypothetical protein
MHIVKLLEKRFPKQKGSIIPVMTLLSLSLLLLGLGLMMMR